VELEQIKNLRRWVTGHPYFRVLDSISKDLGSEIFLTGGLVRDRLADRQTQDVDLTMAREALRIAQKFADQTGGSLVLLREEAETARVVFKEASFDFAKFRGPDLEADLRGRDFTINTISLALSRAFGPEEWPLMDPLGGISDLGHKILRMAGPFSFDQDPLRTLRAFRFSAQLGLTIDPATLQSIKESASKLVETAPERIHHEWLLLLSQPFCFAQVGQMDSSGLLEVLFPELVRLKGVVQNRYHHLSAFDHSWLSLRCLEEIFSGPTSLPSRLAEEVNVYQEEGRKLPWLKWAVLLHDLGKSATAENKGDRLTFHGHASASQSLFQSIAERYRLSHRERNYIVQMIGWHMRPLHLAEEMRKGTLSRRALTRFVREVADDLNGVFALSLADSLAAQGPEKPKDSEAGIMALWEKALLIRDEFILPMRKAPALLSGLDLIELGLTPGPLFKTLLSELEEERFEGGITNKEEAVGWLRKQIASKKSLTKAP